jgi:alpha-galactosidase
LAEFLPKSWYLKNPETISNWKFSLTTVDWRVKNDAELRASSQAQAAGLMDIDLEPSGEEGHLLIKALLGLNEIVSNVNIPNKGQVSNLPTGTIVETNALFRGNELVPILAGALPDDILSITTRHVANQENTLRAGLTCDYELALKTFLNDPLLDNLSYSDGKTLFQKMMTATKAYLPKQWGL